MTKKTGTKKTTKKDSLSAKKQEIRNQVMANIDKIPQPERGEMEKAIDLNFLTKVPAFKKAKIIAAFYPLPHEVSILQLIKKVSKAGKRVCLPVIDGKKKPLTFKEYKFGDSLAYDKEYKIIYEPLEKAKEVTPDLVIVPLFAFDETGTRVGTGHGYYDRTIEALRKKNKDVITVGIAYSFQEFDDLPKGEHDQTLDFVVTDKKVHSF